MKSILILLIAFPFIAFSQDPLTFSEVIEVPGVDKNELFVRGREWFNENFKSSKDVLQISDKETGELSGKGVMNVTYIFRYLGERKTPTDVNFQMSVWVKDGRYKYEITNFIVSNEIAFGLITTSSTTNISYPGIRAKRLNESYLSIKVAIELKSKLLIADLKMKMAKPSKSTDW